LGAKYFGSFPIVAEVGKLAYKLPLPSTARVHPVFHVSQLRKHVGDTPVQSCLLEIYLEGLINAEPVPVLDWKLGRKGNDAVVYVLIERRFPHFSLQA